MTDKKELEVLLESLFVFPADVKQEILKKLEQGVSLDKLARLNKILEQARKLQNNLLIKAIKERPNLARELIEKESTAKRVALNGRKKNIEKNDKASAAAILEKIKKLW